MSQELSAMEAQRRRLTADVAHELRSPITVLTGYLEAISNGELDATPERIASMRGEALRLGRLVEDLRLLSLAEARELPLERTPTDPRSDPRGRARGRRAGGGPRVASSWWWEDGPRPPAPRRSIRIAWRRCWGT
jgi:signal transduction histidine kinase